ncbi:MAG TPA: YbfB/YjiJ family MFS transporter [Burkholderiales bacterium]|jgi:MFS family permease
MKTHTIPAMHTEAPAQRSAREPSAHAALWAGLFGLVAAMGIGRFSFTPLLPLMQQDAGLTLNQGSWLATANYVGYLAGALASIAMAPSPRQAIRFGLAAIAVFTLGMGLTSDFWLWVFERFVGGAASAFVLVGVSNWALPLLTRRERAHWSGHVFAGVGVGIAFAGLIGLAAGVQHWGSQVTWIVLGAIAGVLTIVLWPLLHGDAPAPAAAAAGAPVRFGRRAWITIVCYGIFGYGYIIPATFLPAQARHYIDNPAVFGWIWPVFGTAAAASTILIAQVAGRFTPRRLWVAGLWVLAAGVLAPVFVLNLVTLGLGALCVGGTFMIITMAGIQEARRIGGAHALRLTATMTAAFAIGQIVGPITVPLLAGLGGGLAWPSGLAALALLVSSVVLARLGDSDR